MTEQRMELWSDDILTEFAIKFNSTVVVKTSNNSGVLTNKIDICRYKIGYDFDWHYTLSQWVIYYLANKYVILLDSKVSKEKDFKIFDNEDDEADVSLYTTINKTIKVKNKTVSQTRLEMPFLQFKILFGRGEK